MSKRKEFFQKYSNQLSIVYVIIALILTVIFTGISSRTDVLALFAFLDSFLIIRALSKYYKNLNVIGYLYIVVFSILTGLGMYFVPRGSMFLLICAFDFPVAYITYKCFSNAY